MRPLLPADALAVLAYVERFADAAGRLYTSLAGLADDIQLPNGGRMTVDRLEIAVRNLIARELLSYRCLGKRYGYCVELALRGEVR